MSKITILIQGPLRNNLAIQTIPFYKKYGDVVFSCYEDENTTELEKLGIKLVKIPLPSVSNVFNFNNTFLQTTGILCGLREITTEFTIRVRSDESFPNLDKLVENLIRHPNKIHVTNLYSLKDFEHKFHLGNHIFSSKTDIMIKAFEWAYEICKYKHGVIEYPNKLILVDDDGMQIPMWSEILQTVSFLKALGVNIKYSDSRQQIIDNFFMTPLRDLPNFKWTHKYSNYQPISSETKMEYDPTWTISGDPINRFMTSITEI
jgi:hypothetical protein